MAGLQPPEFNLKVEHQLEMRVAWKDKPKEFFHLVREVAVEWRTVELADKQRHQTRTGRVNSCGQLSAKPFPGVLARRAVDEASAAVVTERHKPGHLARNSCLSTFPSKASSQPARGGERRSGVIHGTWTAAAAGAAAAAAAATTTTAPPAAAAALLGASTRLDDLFCSGEESRGGIFYRFPSVLRWRMCDFFWRHRATGSRRSDRVFAPAPNPVFSYSPGVTKCAGDRRAWGIGAVRTSVQGRAARRYVWVQCQRRGRR